MKNDKTEAGDFGPVFRQYKDNPKGAIKYLMRRQSGECVDAFYRPEIGYIDIVWGEVTDSSKHKGYGLAHIIDKHGADITSLGFSVEDFLSIILQFGDFSVSKKGEEYLLQSEMFRVVIEKTNKGKPKNWILTAFAIKPNKKGRRKNSAT